MRRKLGVNAVFLCAKAKAYATIVMVWLLLGSVNVVLVLKAHVVL